MTTPMLAQFKRKLTSSAILIKKKKENPKRPAQVYMHFVLYGEINLKVQYHINYYKEAIFLKMIRANSIFNTVHTQI